MATLQPSSSDAQSDDGDPLQQGLFMPLAEAPEPWLQLLVNNEELLDEKSTQNLMCASWAMCTAVLRCMQEWRLVVPVRVLVQQNLSQQLKMLAGQCRCLFSCFHSTGAS